MKILLLTPQLPYPAHQGTSLRNYHIIRGLAENHELTLLSFLESNQTVDPQEIAPLLALCDVTIVPVPPRTTNKRLRQLASTRQPDMAHRLHSDRFNISLRRLLSGNHFDIVQIEGLELARTIQIIRIASPRSRIVFDNHNAETELQRRALLADRKNPRRIAATAYSQVQVGRLRRFEAWACQNADWVTAVSESDRSALQALLPNVDLPLTVIPNCLDISQYEDDGTTVPTEFQFDIMFSGKMDYRPNVDAVLWFADQIWPAIRAQRPSTTWVIVGQKPHGRLERLRDLPGITVTGWVESVRPYLFGATVYIMPFRVGSGTRLKLIEAMAAGKAIVSTPMGAEGFPVQHGRELMLVENAAGMATAVLHLLDNPQARQSLAAAAHELAQRYDWRRIIPRFDEIYRQL